MISISLDSGFEMRGESLAVTVAESGSVLNRSGGWHPVKLPCDVHMPLIEDGVIEEPLEADNSFACEWTEKRSWWFRNRFSVDSDLLTHDRVELVIDGVDSRAEVLLNGNLIGSQRSAFYPFVADIKEILNEGENTLVIRVTSGVESVSEADVEHLFGTVITERAMGRGDKRRAYVRKPQYVFGWDWGPRVVTCGIAGAEIRGHSDAAIRHIHAVTSCISEDMRCAHLDFTVEVENLSPISTRDATVALQLTADGDEVLCTSCYTLLQSGINYVDLSASLIDPKLWWPHGMGEQPLYNVEASVVCDGRVVSESTLEDWGIREIELDTDPLADGGRRFCLTVNSVPMFCKGANWIPADSIYMRVTEEKYETLIKEAGEANFNMLRVWGGGIYERDTFYRCCSREGILVWQDFMFSCALYPDDADWFREEVRKEMDYQTKRLRNHPSLALFCGNNENQWGMADWWDEIPFPGGDYCYHHLAPKAVRANCPEIPYWSGSPYGGPNPNCDEVGDGHHWLPCMMSSDMQKRITPEEYDKAGSKFVSEYGYIGPTGISSMRRYMGKAGLDRESRVSGLHTNAFEKDTVLAGIREHYIDTEGISLDDYLLYAGLCQSMILNYSLESIRAKEQCYGALFWMYSDCWGETGWTIIDYYLNRKASFYGVKRALAPVRFILRAEGSNLIVTAVNDRPEAVVVPIEYGYISFDGAVREVDRAEVTIPAFSRTRSLEFSKGQHSTEDGVYTVIPGSDRMIPPASLRSGPFRRLNTPPANPRVERVTVESGRTYFTVSSETYAHGVDFNIPLEVRCSDRFFDLLPMEKRDIAVDGEHQGIQASAVNGR